MDVSTWSATKDIYSFQPDLSHGFAAISITRCNLNCLSERRVLTRSQFVRQANKKPQLDHLFGDPAVCYRHTCAREDDKRGYSPFKNGCREDLVRRSADLLRTPQNRRMKPSDPGI